MTAPTGRRRDHGVAAANGDHVAQDAALLTLARAGGAVAKLGLEPTARPLRAGPGGGDQARSPAGGPPINSKLTMVGRSTDQTTKTVDAVAPLNGSAAPIGSAVQGQITTGRHTGLIVPRAAVVFDETGSHVFTVSANAAHRVFVTVGLDQGDNIEIKGGVQAGAQVAVQGRLRVGGRHGGQGRRPMSFATFASKRRRSLLTLLAC